MNHTISLATADRLRSFAFYRDGLGLEAFGPLAEDGVPEPLQLRLVETLSGSVDCRQRLGQRPTPQNSTYAQPKRDPLLSRKCNGRLRLLVGCLPRPAELTEHGSKEEGVSQARE